MTTISGWALEMHIRPCSMQSAPLVVYLPWKTTTSWEVASLSEQLRALGKLQEGWDGYEAAPVDSHALARASELVSVLRAPPEHILPSTAGTVLLEWEGPFGRASLELGRSTFGFYTAPHTGAPILLGGNSDEMHAEDLEVALATISSSHVPQSMEGGDWDIGFARTHQAGAAYG